MEKLMIFGGQDLLFNDKSPLQTISGQIMMKSNMNTLLCLFTKDCPLKLQQCERWLDEYDDLQFFQLFRLQKQTFQDLLTVIKRTDDNNILKKKYSGGYRPVDVTTQLLCFLWYMATQDSLVYIANRFKVCSATVMNIVNRMLYFLLKLKSKYIRFPQTDEEMLEISQNFVSYPGVIGALDGTHIFVKVEAKQQDSYVDRYRRHSINIMAVCTANNLLTYVFVGYPGSAHDSRVFENSQLYLNIARYGPNSILTDVTKFHLIGDSAFTLQTWLMTPFRGNTLTRTQKNHNFRLSSSRVVIEHTFGLLKGRWRRLQYINTYNICKTVEIATAACVLHNFCILKTDFWEEEYTIIERNEGRDQMVEDAEDGKIKRNEIASSLL